MAHDYNEFLYASSEETIKIPDTIGGFYPISYNIPWTKTRDMVFEPPYIYFGYPSAPYSNIKLGIETRMIIKTPELPWHEKESTQYVVSAFTAPGTNEENKRDLVERQIKPQFFTSTYRKRNIETYLLVGRWVNICNEFVFKDTVTISREEVVSINMYLKPHFLHTSPKHVVMRSLFVQDITEGWKDVNLFEFPRQ